eukprot:scaffold6551_cov51-Phaeocystis_antarctica.AAC.4
MSPKPSWRRAREIRRRRRQERGTSGTNKGRKGVSPVLSGARSLQVLMCRSIDPATRPRSLQASYRSPTTTIAPPGTSPLLTPPSAKDGYIWDERALSHARCAQANENVDAARDGRLFFTRRPKDDDVGLALSCDRHHPPQLGSRRLSAAGGERGTNGRARPYLAQQLRRDTLRAPHLGRRCGRAAAKAATRARAPGAPPLLGQGRAARLLHVCRDRLRARPRLRSAARDRVHCTPTRLSNPYPRQLALPLPSGLTRCVCSRSTTTRATVPRRGSCCSTSSAHAPERMPRC